MMTIKIIDIGIDAKNNEPSSPTYIDRFREKKRARVCVRVRVCLFTNEQADDRYYVNGHEQNPHTIGDAVTYENNSGQKFAALTLLIAASSISSRNQAPF